MTGTTLVRSIARGLKYRPLRQLVGRVVKVRGLATIEDAVRRALSPDLPEGCCLLGPEPHYREAAVAKYGILDLQFSAPVNLLEDDIRAGLPLLRELGFLPNKGDQGSEPRGQDLGCLETLAEDIDKKQAFLLLFLVEAGWPWKLWLWRLWHLTVSFQRGRDFPYQAPEEYLPRRFRVADACVANSANVWLWKHFYL